MLNFLAFDFETTGLYPDDGARAVELAVIRFNAQGEETGRWESLFNPLIPILPEITAIHGITNEEVADAPLFEEVIPELLSFLGDPAESRLIAYNAFFDIGFLKNEWEAAHRASPPPLPPFITHCAMHLVKSSLRLRSYRLANVVQALGIVLPNAHRATDDAIAAGKIWFHCGGPAKLAAGPGESGRSGYGIETFQL
jgi:DNA polymerase III epsilon subunit-like protein